tara:strand:+ start:19462 stop:20268 length:807 start_codon:yes stop_codon:yes gene_type:complete
VKIIKEDIESLGLNKTYSEIVRLGSIDLERKLSIPKGRGQVILVGARPGMGKSSFALDLVRSFVFIENKSAIYFSFELLSKDLSKRLISQSSGVSYKKLAHSELSNKDLKDMSEGIFKLKNLPIYIEDSHGMDIKQMMKSMIEVSHGEELGMIVIDYLQLVPGSDRLRILKQIADEVKIPIIVLSQLGRTVELREDKKPILEDLKEREEVYKYSDCILFLYRKGFYEQNKSTLKSAELIIAKNDNGDTGTINLKWSSNTLSFFGHCYE